jgi:hypothetical protein
MASPADTSLSAQMVVAELKKHLQVLFNAAIESIRNKKEIAMTTELRESIDLIIYFYEKQGSVPIGINNIAWEIRRFFADMQQSPWSNSPVYATILTRLNRSG